MKFLSDILAKAGLTVDGVVTLNNTATGQTPAANDNSTKLATTAWVRGFVTPYSLPIASGLTLGGIKIGSGLAIDGTGIVSVAATGVGAIRALQQFTATAGQTVFTVSGGYTPGLIDVFLNGVLLTPTSITASNGTTFTLSDAALVNDVLDVFVYNPIYGGFISSTDQVPEGATNLYFTNARARAAITLTTTGTSGAATYNSSTGVLNIPSYIGGVVSIFGRTGTVVAVSGDYTTALVTEVTNLYYTDARARAAISVTGSGSYDSATGIITVTGGVTSVNTLTGAVTLTTTNIAEGTNLYYTDARVGTYLTTNSYATQTYVGTQIANLVASAPATLDTLNELAVALGNDPSFATTVATSIGTKVPQTRTITINGTTLDLSADRSFTIASGVTSFNTRTGAIVPVSGDYTTALVTESGNLYYTDARARLALSFVAGSGGYNSTTGVITIPTNNNQITNGANYITLVSLSSTATGLTYTNTTGVFSLTAGYSIPTDASQTTWDSAYTNRITSLTTTGTSGAATLSGNVLNIPQYQGGVTSFNTRTGAITLTSSDVTTALTYTPVTNARTLTINGDAYDLTADRTWTIGVSPSARTIQTYTATAAQTTFTVTGGYVVGLVDVFINGVRLTSADFTATNGTTVVLTTGTGVNNIVDVIKYTSAFTASSALRQVTYFTATAGQTSFTVSYTPGLVDVYYNGSKLSSSEYTASNGTTIVLANAAVVNDALEVISYAYSVGAFTGLSTTRTLTINGTSYDLSADRTWTLTTSNISEGSNLYYTDTRARAAISLTTTGSSGASTYTSGVINIPTYTLSGLGGQTELNGTGLVRMAGTTVSYDNATYATQSYVTTAVANLVNSAPSTLDTLNELAAALGNDANFATTVTTSIGTKQAQLNGTGFVKISGTTISYDNSTYLTTASASSTYQTIITNPITGTGTTTRVAFFDSTNSVTSSSGFYWDNVNGRLAVGKNSADARLEVYGSTKGQIRANGGPSIGAGVDFYTELTGADRRNWGLHTESTNAGDFELLRSASAGVAPTIRTLSIIKSGEVSVFNLFSIVDPSSSGTGMYLDQTGRVSGRNWSLLNGNTAVGEFSIKDETAAATRFKIATDGVVTSYISALIGISTDAAAYMRISENQIWRTGGGALYINNSGTGSVIVAGGGGAILLGTATQSGSNLITTKDMGVTGSNTYFGTGQVRIGGGSDHTTNTVLSVAPGVVNFDRPGVGGGALKIHSDGKIGINATTNNGYQLEVQTNATTAGLWVQTGGTTNSYTIADFRTGTNASAFVIKADLQSTFGGTVTIATGTTANFALGINSNSTFAFGSTNGRRAAIIAHESVGDSGLQFGWDTVDKTGIIAGSANSTGGGIDFYAYDGSNWANRMRMTKTGVLGIGVNPSSSDWVTRSAIMLGGYGTALSSYNGGGGATELLHNGIVTSGFTVKYAITAASTKQYMDGNNIIWFRAPIGTQGDAITYTELMNISSSGLGINTGGSSTLRLSVSEAGSTISSGNITFASQAKGIDLYNQNSGTTDNLVGYWFSTGPHKAGIASGRTNAASSWAVDLRFFVHGPEIAALDNTYEKMRLYGEGNLTINGSLTQSGSLSDITLKENLVKIVTPLEKLSQISGYTFTWKENAPARQHISNIVEDAGLIAQEVELILPEIVRTNGDGSKALNYNGVVGLLVEAIKELKAELDDLKSKN